MTGLPDAVTRVVTTAAPDPLARFEWSEAPDVSIVIVTFGTGPVLERCMVALSGALDGIAAEVIVVDNLHPELGSWAGDRLCLLTDGVRLVRTGANLGFGGGNGVGVELARSDTLCLMNPDVVVATGQLERLLSVSAADRSTLVAPGFANLDGSVQELGARLISNGETRPVVEVGAHDVDYASAACWVFDRHLFDAVGGFDPVFHPAYYEDVDFVLRAGELGFGLTIVDEVLVVHEQRASTGRPPDVERQRAAFLARWGDLVATRPGE